MKKIKIAISGKANTGKDTASKFLMEELNIEDSCCKIAFADSIKNIVLETIPSAEKESLWGPSDKRSEYIPDFYKITWNNDNYLEKNKITYRTALLDLGKLGRYYDPDIWALNTIYQANKSDKHIIISDLRFKNEMSLLKKEGFIIIRINRSNNDYNIDDISDKDLDDVTDFDYIIDNDSDLDSLRSKIKEIANKINTAIS